MNFVCGPHIYEFGGWLFETHSYCGPWPLKKNFEPKQQAGRKFYKMFDRFYALSADEKEKYRVGGGCVSF